MPADPHPSSGPPILDCAGLSFSYGDHRVLRDVSVAVHERDMIGVIGPNGSGKSTLIRLMAGLLKPSAGRVSLRGRSMKSLPRSICARDIAVLAQEDSPDFGFTVREEVTLGRAPHHGGLHFEDRRDHEVVDWAMEKTGVAGLADRRIGELSGGERQRVRIARGLAQEPAVFLLDEPTNHLDLYSQLVLVDLMREINSDGIAVVVVSHEINFIARTCRHVKVLHSGVFRFAGSPAEVITEEAIATAFRIHAHVDTSPVDGLPRITPVGRLET